MAAERLEGLDHLDRLPEIRRRLRSPDDAFPCYTETQMRRRESRRPSLPISDLLAGLAPQAHAYLLESEEEEYLDALGLDGLERLVARMRMDGLTVREVAAAVGVKKWRVESAIKSIRRKYLSLRDRDSSDGWQEAYREDLRRRGCRRPEG
jgi:DNA-directed RNA polymerase specialized sigma24 family protein